MPDDGGAMQRSAAGGLSSASAVSAADVAAVAAEKIQAAAAAQAAAQAAQEAATHPSRNRYMCGPLPLADVISWVFGVLYLIQPGVDKAAVHQWILDNVFGGDFFRMRVLGPTAFIKVLEWSSLAFYTSLYALAIPAVERYRAGPPGSVWPWNSPKPEVRAEYRALQWRSFWGTVKLHLFVLSLEAARYFYLEQRPVSYEAMLHDPAYEAVLPERIPPWYVSARQIIVSILVIDVGFYWGHRLLHSSPFWYRWHKKHHEFVDTGILAAFHVSIVEAILTIMLPAALAVGGQRMHLYTVWQLSFPMIMNGVWAHCGYHHPFRFMPLLILPIGSNPERAHDMHHRNGAVNLGSGHTYFLWDRIAGTFRSPDSLLTAAEHQHARLASYDLLAGNKTVNGHSSSGNGHTDSNRAKPE